MGANPGEKRCASGAILASLPGGRESRRRGIASRRASGIDVLIVLAFTAAILGTVSYFGLKIYFRSAGVPYGVHYLGYDLGGLSGAEAATRVRDITTWAVSQPMYLHFDDRLWLLRYPKHFQFKVDDAELARLAVKVGREDRTVKQQILHHLLLDHPRVDLPFSISLDRAHTQTSLSSTLSDVLMHRVHARLLPGSRVELKFESDDVGLTDILDAMEESVSRTPITSRREIHVQKKTRGGESRVVGLYDERQGFSVVLGSRKVTLDLVDPLTYDAMSTATERIHEKLINPGQRFSVSEVIGRIPVDPAADQEQIGLGHLATALYEPLLKAGVKVEARTPHPHRFGSLAFVQPGFDAAFGSGRDLRFLNDRNIPMLLTARLEYGVLEVQVRSIQQLPFLVKIETGKISREPYQTRWIQDPTVPRGEERVKIAGIEGVRVKIYRTFIGRADNRPISSEVVSDDSYGRRDAVVLVPSGFVAPPPPRPALPSPEPEEPVVQDPVSDEIEDGDGAPAGPVGYDFYDEPGVSGTGDTMPDDRLYGVEP